MYADLQTGNVSAICNWYLRKVKLCMLWKVIVGKFNMSVVGNWYVRKCNMYVNSIKSVSVTGNYYVCNFNQIISVVDN